jgi:hypothetical protein
MTFTFTSEAATTTQPTQGATMNIEMIEPTEQPATTTQPTQGVFMDNFQAPNLVGIIMQALESHITALVDKRFNERMNDLKDPTLPEIKDIMTEMFDEMLDDKLTEKMSEINDELYEKIAEAISDHTSEYDHDEYDQCVRNVDDAGLDDLEDKIRDVLRNSSFTINL